MIDAAAQVIETRRAFDSVAPFYDGPFGNNAIVQRMRGALLTTLTRRLPARARLLDLGCGTGIDAAFLAGLGHEVTATDSSPEMVARTRERAAEAGLASRILTLEIGIHELDRLRAGPFDAIYSDLGPFNCVPDLAAAARSCASLLKPGGLLVASVMGRTCPWEIAAYLLRGNWSRARVRFARGTVPVGLNQRTVWTRYYAPREFFRPFADRFSLQGYRALCLFLPPPYMVRFCERLGPVAAGLRWLDDHAGGLPLLRDAGDHFLIVLARRDAGGAC